MRSRKIVTSECVQKWVLSWLSAIPLPDHGWLCTAAVVWKVLVRSAARRQTVSATCAEFGAPSLQGILNALREGLPKRATALERQLVTALQAHIPRGVLRRQWQVAIDWHLIPYYGQPAASDQELIRSAARSGTTRFHTYATACVLQQGQRYTVALTWVKRNESTVAVLQRLRSQMLQIGLKIKTLLLDRQFFSAAVTKWLIDQRQPFLMPVSLRGRKPKPGRRAKGLRALKRRPAGWYSWTQGTRPNTVTFWVCVTYRSYLDHRSRKRHNKKLLFAAWRVNGSPPEVAQQYRGRFGIESSYRQLNQARIRTCTRDPNIRLLFVALALLLRNVWVWIHGTVLCNPSGECSPIRLGRLPFSQLLDWLARLIEQQLHNHSPPRPIYP